MTSINFLKSLTITAAALGSKFGVPVYVGGQTACTDGRSIRLPDVEGIETIGRNEILGYLVHECGHIRFTNMSSTGDTPLERSLVNALEDVRIEHEMANVYGGARALLFDLHKPLLASLSANVKEQPLPACLGLYLCSAGAELMGNYSLPDETQAFRDRLEKEFGNALVNQIDDCLKAVPSMKCTDDAKQIVKWILKLLEDQAKQPDGQSVKNEDKKQGQQQKQQNSKASQSSKSGAGSDSSKSQADKSSSSNKPSEQSEAKAGGKPSGSDGSDEARSQNDSSSKDSEDAQSASQSQSESQSQAGSSSSQAGKKKNGSDAAQKVLQATEKDLKDLNRFDISSSVKKQINQAMRKHAPADPNTSEAVMVPAPADRWPNLSTCRKEGRIEQAKADSTYARRALQGLIQTRTRASTRTATSGAKLSVPNMARLATWNLRVFEKRTERKAVNTAVNILLDMSGSMSLAQETAIRAALALTMCLTTFKHVNPALSVFGGTKNVHTVLPHGQRLLRKAEDTIARLKAFGGTPLAEAMLSGTIALSQTREERKVMIVVTDGIPDDIPPTISLIEKLQKSGVIVIGIGIGKYQCVDQLFKHYISIDQVEELQTKFFQVARELFV